MLWGNVGEGWVERCGEWGMGLSTLGSLGLGVMRENGRWWMTVVCFWSLEFRVYKGGGFIRVMSIIEGFLVCYTQGEER